MKTYRESLLQFALDAGQLMMESGAETYRVEELIDRICLSVELERVDSFVTPTGIFVSIQQKDESFSLTRRVRQRGIDLHRIEEINSLSREFATGEMSVEDARLRLKEIASLLPFSKHVRYANIALFGAAFALLYKGGLQDALSSAVLSVFLYAFLQSNWLQSTNYFFRPLFGATATAMGAQWLSALFVHMNRDIIIIATIMQLVPGVAITNAIRDSISGDLISGVTRGSEAVFVAIAIALGAGIGLFITGGF
ncbi:MAG TPA: threonine/serine exporter family protein [Tissierellia bacterium]|nr:threonine/serine exporter family protein [Tissierellia bacterium]